MKHIKKHKGFTLIELLVVMSIIALLLSILMPALGRAKAEAMLTKDQSQIKAVFSGFSFWTGSHNGRFPIPGLAARLPTQGGSGPIIKGRGPEDFTKNDHASVLSMCVMQNLFTTDILYAPTEQGDFVFPMESYDYNYYNPSPQGDEWELWDPEFQNDLESACNNSYGIMPVTGKRKQQNWGVSTHSPTSFAIVGTRGPEEGIPDEYSRTNLFHGIERDWKGAIFFGDGHGDVLETFYPSATTYVNDGGVASPDNIFFEETDQVTDDDYMTGGLGQGQDVVLTHVIETIGNIDGTDGKGGRCDAFLHD
jgi:prepilin-type N-terminal cleavage/methylation domain-containing protein